MSKFVVVGEYGEGLALAMRLEGEGHDVALLMKNEEWLLHEVGLGMTSVRAYATMDAVLGEDPDCVVMMKSSWSEEPDTFVIGGNKWATTVGYRPDYMAACLDACGIKSNAARQGPGSEDIEWSVLGWYSTEGRMTPAFLQGVWRRLVDGGRGPLVYGMGTVLVPIVGTPRIVQETLGKIGPLMDRVKYVGPVAMPIKVGDKLEVLGLQPSIGRVALWPLLELLRQPIGRTLLSLEKGGTALPVRNEVVMGVRVTQVPSMDTMHEGRPVKGITDANAKHIWPVGLGVIGGEVQVLSPDGDALWVTARGTDVREARNRVLRTIGNLDIEGATWREDIGVGVEKTLGSLRKEGWL